MATLSEASLLVINRKGIHTRAAAEIVKVVNQYNADVHLLHDGKRIRANNMIQILTLAVGCGEQVSLSATGKEAEQVLTALRECFAKGFYPEADCKPS